MRNRQPRRGFTLVELLIVVAIIGVLSTIGIPTFRKMIQKSRQAEAKTMLGGLYTSEAAFYAEWGLYGGNLRGIGFDVDGLDYSSNHGRYPGTYHVGFPESGACNVYIQIYQYPSGTTDPKVIALNAGYPAYYTAPMLGFYSPNTTLAGYCLPAAMPPDGSSFRASASGVIAPSLTPATAGASGTDTWSIDQDRILRNVNSGVR